MTEAEGSKVRACAMGKWRRVDPPQGCSLPGSLLIGQEFRVHSNEFLSDASC